MSNVLTIDNIDAVNRNGEHRMRLLSRGLTWVFTALLGFIALTVLTGLVVSLFFPAYVEIGPNGGELELQPFTPATLDHGMTWLAALSLSTRLAGIADIVIMSVPLALVVFNLRGLFRLYAAGIVFANENAQHLKRIGLWLIAYPFAKFGANMLFQLFGGPDRAWFSSTLLFALLLGAIVVVIAQVMEMGHAIERERAEFV
ncbi:MAG TPA: DUF2975 domain-containing protein [Rhizomicrobium sp.]|jgi:hypothetical protein|nr:DUF2975 domain-containing protein [Rhizomicrobium sp.]